jgi:hypothetical protein
LPVQGLSEYEVHCLATGECRRRTAMAVLIQRDLDQRHQRAVRQSLALKTVEELATWWDQAIHDGDWAGVFWAVMTHPRCAGVLEEAVLGQVHMLQHQVGMANRVDLDKLNELAQSHQSLAEDRQALQSRVQHQAAEHAVQVGQLHNELAAVRQDLVRARAERDQALAKWQQLQHWQHAQADVADPVQLADLAQAHTHALDEIRQLRRLLKKQQEHGACRVGQAEAGALAGMERPLASDPSVCDPCNPIDLAPCTALCAQRGLGLGNRAVLCVGGRAGAVSGYREVVENQGARFAHHDGGDEQSHERLAPQLHAADVVICQVACISHNAYWRVKEHCKRTGTPCLFLPSASKSSLERALAYWAAPSA